ncbi:MAG: sulfate transporter, partial [Candidatus Altiarchaeota archaeon]|nr:sulfate transporter [Candidatus Altiarchaeota archaeon]
GVILFFAGLELAASIKSVGSEKKDIYVMLLVAGLAMWNMGVAFLAGIILYQVLKRGWLKL